jgi:hypothetical protein
MVRGMGCPRTFSATAQLHPGPEAGAVAEHARRPRDQSDDCEAGASIDEGRVALCGATSTACRAARDINFPQICERGRGNTSAVAPTQVQNLPMWQSYAVKRQTVASHCPGPPGAAKCP